MRLALLLFAWMYGGWCIFIIYAGVAAKWDQLRPGLRLSLIPVGVIGAIMDVSFNLTVATVLFLQLPSTFTLTARMAKNKSGPDGWRKELSSWVCMNMLDVFQAGHC